MQRVAWCLSFETVCSFWDFSEYLKLFQLCFTAFMYLVKILCQIVHLISFFTYRIYDYSNLFCNAFFHSWLIYHCATSALLILTRLFWTFSKCMCIYNKIFCFISGNIWHIFFFRWFYIVNEYKSLNFVSIVSNVILQCSYLVRW